ncbi:MAG: outer membrane protein assembly factor BamA [Pseudorhodobacter sp.]
MYLAAEGNKSRNILRRAGTSHLALAVFLSLSTVCAVAPQEVAAQTYRFSNVRIEGNERVDPSTILTYAGIGQGQAVSAGALNDAYQRITGSGLFESVEVIPSGGTLVIRVKEYPTINIINFEGNRRMKDEDLAELVQSRSRRIYSPAQAEADAALISDAYEVQGRMAATVTPKIIRRDGNRVDLAFEISEGRPVEVERLSFVGNRAYSDRRLRQVLETKQAGLLRRFIRSDTFIPDRLEVDKQLLRDFYLARGYIDFQVLDSVGEMTRERDGFFVTFTVREGRRFKFGDIRTISEVEGIDVEEFRRAVRLRRGVTYSPSVVENNIARMENLALRKGLNFIAVEPRVTRNERDGTLDIVFAITRGPRVFVERIDIEGNATTLDEVVRRQFRTAEGDPFNPREIRRAAERIRALGYFADAAVDAEQGSGADQVVVNVDVEEQPTGSLSFGASYGADSGVGFAVGLQETNFLGRGQTVALNITTASDDAAASFNFIEPAFMGRDLEFSFGVNYKESDYSNSYYDTRVAGINFGLGFPVGEYSRLQVNYRAEDSRVKNVDPASSYILHQEEARQGELASSIGYRFTYDTRTTGLNPLGGVLLRFSQDFAGLGGDLRYIRSEVMAMAERRIMNEEVTVRAVFEGGYLHMRKGSSRVTDRYFGTGKIRGFEGNGLGPRDLNVANQDALGGNMFAVARFEAEFPVGLPEEYGIRGGLFLDVGSVWDLDNTGGGAAGADPVDDGMNLRSSVGVSVFWDTPIGPLRFNLSHAFKKEDYDKKRSFDLTIQSQF